MRPIALMLAVLVLTAPSGQAQETIDVEVGAGEAPAIYAGPGLETRTPSAEPIAPEDVQIYLDRDDQLVGWISLPDQKLATLVQPEGRDWRAFRMGGLFWTSTVVILLTLAGLAAFYLWRGRITIPSGRSGRWVTRFGAAERFAHWATAISFIVLALTGLVMTFGRFLLIPLIGHANFTALAQGSMTLHNWSGAAFAIGVVLILVFWIRDNLPNRADWEWIKQGGGMLRKEPGSFHPETDRFNAGQKGIFWVVVLGGITMTVTGYLLMAPFAVTGVSGMQVFHVIHTLMAVLMIAVILAHIYIGTLGMEGAFEAMGRGEVDENWAREHHRGWYEAQARGEARPAPQGAPPATPAE